MTDRERAWEKFFSSRMNHYYHQELRDILKKIDFYSHITLYVLACGIFLSIFGIIQSIFGIILGFVFGGVLFLRKCINSKLSMHELLTGDYLTLWKNFEKIFNTENYSGLNTLVEMYNKIEILEAKHEGKANQKVLNKAYNKVLKEIEYLYE
jgi:hypothetical protein